MKTNIALKNNYHGPHIDLELKGDNQILGTPNREWASPYTQQGDCILRKVGAKYAKYFSEHFSEIPKNAVVRETNLVLKGNTNSHALYGGSFELYDLDGTVFVRVNSPCVLAHVKDLESLKRAEHHGQWIPKGDYYYRGVMETDHIAKLERKVVD